MINLKRKLYTILALTCAIFLISCNNTPMETAQHTSSDDTDFPLPQVKDLYREKIPPIPEISTKKSYAPTPLTDLQTITADHKYRTKFFIDVKKVHSVCGNNIECLEKYSSLGVPLSQLILGLLTYNQAGEDKVDATKGVNLIKQSANAQYAYGQFILGQMYVLGAISVKPNRKVGYSLFHEAANNDKEGAVLNKLGIYSLNGSHGVPYNITNAKAYFKKASNLGYVEATVNLGLIYFSGTNMNPDLTIANQYFSQACILHNIYGCYYQGLASLQDNFSHDYLDKEQMQLHIAKDILLAKSYLRTHHKKYVPNQSEREAHYDYKHIFNLNKIAHEKGIKDAFAQIKDSALKGNVDAIQTIIGYYMKGFGTSQNRIRGIAWAKIFNDITYDNTLYIMTQKQSPKAYTVKADPIYKSLKATIVANQSKQNMAKAQKYEKELEFQKLYLVNLEADITGDRVEDIRKNLNYLLSKTINDGNGETVESSITDSDINNNEGIEVYDDSLSANQPTKNKNATTGNDDEDTNHNDNPPTIPTITNPTKPTSNNITSNNITSNNITSNNITSNNITSNNIPQPPATPVQTQDNNDDSYNENGLDSSMDNIPHANQNQNQNQRESNAPQVLNPENSQLNHDNERENNSNKPFLIDNGKANLSPAEQRILNQSKGRLEDRAKHKPIAKNNHQRVCSPQVIKKLKANPNKRLLTYFCING